METKRALYLANLAASACILVSSGLARGQEQPTARTGEVREIMMTACKYRFDPKEIVVKKGERVRLVITALDRDHGFRLDAFNLNQKLEKGKPTSLEFTADRAGTFSFKCSDLCGLGHPKMKGELIVEEQ